MELMDQPNNLVITKRFYYGTKRINRNIIEENIYLRRKNYYRGQQIIKYQKYLNKYNQILAEKGEFAIASLVEIFTDIETLIHDKRELREWIWKESFIDENAQSVVDYLDIGPPEETSGTSKSTC